MPPPLAPKKDPNPKPRKTSKIEKKQNNSKERKAPRKAAPVPPPVQKSKETPRSVAPPTPAPPTKTAPNFRSQSRAVGGSRLAPTSVAEPTAVSPGNGNGSREGKGRLRGKDNKTGTTQRKQNGSGEGKKSAESDMKVGSKIEKKIKKSTTESTEVKSDFSDFDDKTPEKKPLNKDMASRFFKQMLESQKSRKRSVDSRTETKPETSQMSSALKSYRSQMLSLPISEPETEMFNENGEPIWAYQEEKEKFDEEGNLIANDILVKEMVLANIKVDEKSFYEYLMEYMSCELPRGNQLPEDYEFNVYGPIEQLEANNEYVNPEAVSYNTVRNAVESSEMAVKRFSQKHGGTEESDQQYQETSTMSLPPPKPSESAEELKQCPETVVTINKKETMNIIYDRHHPIESIQKFRKKLNSVKELLTQNDS
uniref:Protein SPT2 homolog n=1 Tax=Caenorhabditis tropicalis TaxID=1561998 RepID=A0A1I7TDP0_9PELO